MHDMLVRLYDLPNISEQKETLRANGIEIRRCGAYERHIAAQWIGETFSPKWISEFKIAMGRQPAACIIATKERHIIGFACYDVTARGFLGPMGVDPSCRESGIGRALLVTALECLFAQGYAYAVIGGVGPAEFYSKCVGAVPIENSTPGIYRDILPEHPSLS